MTSPTPIQPDGPSAGSRGDAGRVLVLGVGNPLMGDDGVGPRVVELIQTGYAFPGSVELIDAGTMGFAMLAAIRAADHLIVIDSVRDTGHPPGSVMRMTPEQIAPNQIKHSMHDVALVDVLQAAELIGSTPDTVAIAVQIDRLEEAVCDLTQAVEAAVPIAIAAVLAEMASLGVEARPRASSTIAEEVARALAEYSASE